jgi:hypothetical protein
MAEASDRSAVAGRISFVRCHPTLRTLRPLDEVGASTDTNRSARHAKAIWFHAHPTSMARDVPP